MGSTVVMVWEAPASLFMVSSTISPSYDQVARGESIKLGQELTKEVTPEVAREQLARLKQSYIYDERNQEVRALATQD